MKTVNIAILGGGAIGKVHIYAYQTLPFYVKPLPVKPRIKYVVNSRPESASEAAALADGAVPTTDWKAAIHDPEIDVVNVCLPNRLHFPALKEAILANKHIYCEKPLLLNAAEADEIAPLLKNYRGISQVAFHTRFFASAIKMKEMIKQGEIGDILEFRGSYLQNSHVDPTRPIRWKNLRSEGGGALTDIGSHLIDFTDWLAGPLTETFNFSASSDPENPERAEDSIAMIWKNRNGAIGTLHVSKMAHGAENDMTLEVFGRQGAIRFSLESPHYLEFFDGRLSTSPLGGKAGWTRIPVGNRYLNPDSDFPAAKSGIGWVRAHCTAMARFLRNVEAGKILNEEPDFERGLYVQKLLEMCRIQ